MAKQCLYCGQPLAKEDARFCNECGQAQYPVPVSAPNTTAATSGSAMIKVKLPPKELLPEENPFAQQEESHPKQVPPGTTHPPQVTSRKELSAPPSSRLPKRPVRLTAQASAEAKEFADKFDGLTVAKGFPNKIAESTHIKEPPPKIGEPSEAKKVSGKIGDSLATPARPGSTACPESAPALPTPSPYSFPKSSVAEEASTMVLSGWREELERVRKEQAATKASITTPEAATDKPSPARTETEPTRPFSTSIEGQPAWPKLSEKTRLEPHEKATQPEAPQKTEQARSNRTTSKPSSPVEQPRRELHVKVWEQQPTMQFPHVSVEKEQGGPAPAVEHAPFANVAFDAGKQAEQIAQVETIHWEALPTTPAPQSQKSVAKEETIRWEALPQTPVPQPKGLELSKPAESTPRETVPQTPAAGQQNQTPAKRPEIKQPPMEIKQSPNRDAQQTKEKLSASDRIEDQPTAHMAVSEITKLKPGITIERTSTPAPSTQPASPSGEVEDQPTRPMLASAIMSHAPTEPRGSQPKEQQPAPPASPFAAPNPASISGITASQPLNAAQAPNTFGGMEARPQSRQTFDPAKMPPLPLNPASQPGSSLPGFGMQNTQQRSGDALTQRPVSFTPPGASWPSISAATGAEANKPRKKKRVSRKKMLITLIVLLVIGIGGWLAYYQYSSGGAQPYQSFQNSTLGVTLNYPQGWTATVNQAQTSAHFADSNQTDQITLSTATTNGQQLGQYLIQESAQLGMTGTHTDPTLTFGGANWQEVQGSITQKGVSNTLSLYVTEHNGRFYTLIFQAQSATFAQIEQEDFKPLRDSFSFL